MAAWDGSYLLARGDVVGCDGVARGEVRRTAALALGRSGTAPPWARGVTLCAGVVAPMPAPESTPAVAVVSTDGLRAGSAA